MTLLDRSIQGGGLLTHRRVAFQRVRTTITGAGPDTGAPITSTATSTVHAYHQWLSGIEAQDFKGDASAVLITTPGQLRAGDRVSHVTLGAFLVLEEGPYPHGSFDRVPVRRA